MYVEVYDMYEAYMGVEVCEGMQGVYEHKSMYRYIAVEVCDLGYIGI